MNLHNLESPKPNKKTRKRLGRGQGSGHGAESGKGHNGQKARSGAKYRAWFEGGQMPLQRRVPKFGFKNPFRREYTALNVARIAEFIESGKLSEKITIADLITARLIDKNERVKLLANGDITTKVEIEVHAYSETAKSKIEAAGGTVTQVA